MRKNTMFRRLFAVLLLLSALLLLPGCDMLAGNEEDANDADTLYLYNWGDYIDDAVIEQFEEETGIHVIKDEYDTNESMYPRVAEGAESYDVICPSDYMIDKMRQNGLLQPLDFEAMPNARAYIGQAYYKQSQAFDPDNAYSVPYCWGTVGILYNAKMVDEPVDSWTILWNPKYRGSILMQDSARDAMMVALRVLGYSMNTTDEGELKEARDLLIAEKPLVQAYGIDDIRDKLASGEAALGVIFSGEAIGLMEANPDLRFVPAPKEGTNVWIDSWVIPKNARHKENAEKFIDFLCRPDIAAKNFEFLGYSMPNTALEELVADDMDDGARAIAFPDESIFEGQETYQYLGEAMDKLYTRLWLQVKVE